MSELDDIMGDLFAAIDQLPDAPSVEHDAPSDMFATRNAMYVAAGMLRRAADLYGANMLQVLNLPQPKETPTS